jgi:bifunctional DNA-binding transcriptional regulator/antitoxin component of YhaV-PrlF toxin-antitoxin module
MTRLVFRERSGPVISSLLKGNGVKKQVADGLAYRRSAGQTRISSKHQVTIPMSAFTDAGFKPGDAVTAEAIGPGRVVLTRQDALLDEFSGALSTNGGLRHAIEALRDEWA